MNTPVADPDLLATLPPVLRAVVKALGFGRARELLIEFGGVNITVAKHNSRLLRLDRDELARLREHLRPHMDHNDRVWMPKADKLLIMVRNAQIRREASRESINKQARRYNLSSRHILNIRSEREDDAKRQQIDLF